MALETFVTEEGQVEIPIRGHLIVGHERGGIEATVRHDWELIWSWVRGGCEDFDQGATSMRWDPCRPRRQGLPSPDAVPIADRVGNIGWCILLEEVLRSRKNNRTVIWKKAFKARQLDVLT